MLVTFAERIYVVRKLELCTSPFRRTFQDCPKRQRVYLSLLEELYEEQLYNPRSIVQMCADSAIFADSHGHRLRMAKNRAKTALYDFAEKHGFPLEGDGFVRIAGQSTPAWLGHRWLAILEGEFV